MKIPAPRKITILYNRDQTFALGKEDRVIEKEYQDDVLAIKQSLELLKFEVELYEVNEKSFEDIPRHRTDLYLNLSYGIGDAPYTEHKIPLMLDSTGIPYTGADSYGIEQTMDKAYAKKIFQTHRIPTPPFGVFTSPKDKLSDKLSYPLFVKPIREDCSVGIDNSSVVVNDIQLKKRIKYIIKKYKQPALVEKFINTRELRVTVLGNKQNLVILPISELVFGREFEKKGLWKIDNFAAKFETDSIECKDTKVVCPANLDKELEKKIKEYAKDAYFALHGRDYARFDIRLDENDVPYFLEINLNPGIGPNDATSFSAQKAGLSYPEFIKKIIDIAYIRYNSS